MYVLAYHFSLDAAYWPTIEQIKSTMCTCLLVYIRIYICDVLVYILCLFFFVFLYVPWYIHVCVVEILLGSSGVFLVFPCGLFQHLSYFNTRQGKVFPLVWCICNYISACVCLSLTYYSCNPQEETNDLVLRTVVTSFANVLATVGRGEVAGLIKHFWYTSVYLYVYVGVFIPMCGGISMYIIW